MLHLPALPGAPDAQLAIDRIEERVVEEARVLEGAGFGDAPFFKDGVGPETVATMTRLATRIRSEAPGLTLGNNVFFPVPPTASSWERPSRWTAERSAPSTPRFVGAARQHP